MRYLITAALPYANGPIHIGHIAGAYLPADIYARYLRKKGEDVLFVCGSDEHGSPITIRALKENKHPKEIVDYYHQLIRDTFSKLGISFDVYYRTSDKLHHQISQKFFLNLYKKKFLYVKSVNQFYDEVYKVFLPDRYIKGECPRCSFPEAYGDQCEKCGRTLVPQDLINPISILSGTPPSVKKTDHLFFPFSKFYSWVLKFLFEGKDDDKYHHDTSDWKLNVMGYIKSWLTEPLHDRAITRDLTWGIKVPLKEFENKVLYVWFEAPIGYISAVYHYFDDEKKANEWWKNPETKLIHFIGKDNIVFHAILFPIMLKAHSEYILPVNVPANEFLNLEDAKISTSRNWAVWVDDFLARYQDRVDDLRFVICRILPENKDANFKWEDFKRKVNEELVGTLGNFISRFFNLALSLNGGKIPDIRIHDGKELGVLKRALECFFTSHKMIEKFSFRTSLDLVMEIARIGNVYLSEVEPWRNPSQEAQHRALYTMAIITSLLKEGMEPFMPYSAKKLQEMMNLPEIKWNDLNNIPKIVAGLTLNKYSHLFKYFTQEDVQRELILLKQNIGEKKEKELKEAPPTNPLEKIKIVIGTIKEVYRIKNSNKLLHLRVDIGEKMINVVAGLAKHYSPEQLLNKQVPVVINIGIKKIMDIESEGMILVGNKNGEIALLTTDKEISPGTPVE